MTSVFALLSSRLNAAPSKPAQQTGHTPNNNVPIASVSSNKITSFAPNAYKRDSFGLFSLLSSRNAFAPADNQAQTRTVPDPIPSTVQNEENRTVKEKQHFTVQSSPPSVDSRPSTAGNDELSDILEHSTSINEDDMNMELMLMEERRKLESTLYRRENADGTLPARYLSPAELQQQLLAEVEIMNVIEESHNNLRMCILIIVVRFSCHGILASARRCATRGCQCDGYDAATAIRYSHD